MLTTTNYSFKKPELTDSPPDITATNGNWDTLDTNLKDAQTKASDWDNFKNNGGTFNKNTRTMGAHTVAGSSTSRGEFPMINFDILGTGGACIFSNAYKQVEFRQDSNQNGDLAKLIVGDIDMGIISKSTNGYTKLPNGFILQWGTVTLPATTGTNTFYLPMTFPNANLNAQVTILDNGNVSSSSACRLLNFGVSSIQIANSLNVSMKATYICIGY